MTIGFRSILVVNSVKNMTICSASVNFFVMCASLVKAKILKKCQFWRIFFIFVANGPPFSKMLIFFYGDIKFFLKKYLLFLKSVNFWWRFHLLKNNILCKSVSFLANDWIIKYSDKVMSCKLWGKVTSVSVNINFGARMSLFYEKKLKFWEKCWLFH